MVGIGQLRAFVRKKMKTNSDRIPGYNPKKGVLGQLTAHQKKPLKRGLLSISSNATMA
jgi:hypothetical protein